MGRIHLGRQDLDELQTRKTKGLKRGRDVPAEDEQDQINEDLDLISVGADDSDGEGVSLKRARLE